MKKIQKTNRAVILETTCQCQALAGTSLSTGEPNPIHILCNLCEKREQMIKPGSTVTFVRMNGSRIQGIVTDAPRKIRSSRGSIDGEKRGTKVTLIQVSQVSVEGRTEGGPWFSPGKLFTVALSDKTLREGTFKERIEADLASDLAFDAAESAV